MKTAFSILFAFYYLVFFSFDTSIVLPLTRKKQKKTRKKAVLSSHTPGSIFTLRTPMSNKAILFHFYVLTFEKMKKMKENKRVNELLELPTNKSTQFVLTFYYNLRYFYLLLSSLNSMLISFFIYVFGLSYDVLLSLLISFHRSRFHVEEDAF